MSSTWEKWHKCYNIAFLFSCQVCLCISIFFNCLSVNQCLSHYSFHLNTGLNNFMTIFSANFKNCMSYLITSCNSGHGPLGCHDGIFSKSVHNGSLFLRNVHKCGNITSCLHLIMPGLSLCTLKSPIGHYKHFQFLRLFVMHVQFFVQ